MNQCKDCDRPLTTYQGINQRPEDAEVFCAYCEDNPPIKQQALDAAYESIGITPGPYYYVEYNNFAERVADKTYKDYNKPWRIMLP